MLLYTQIAQSLIGKIMELIYHLNTAPQYKVIVFD